MAPYATTLARELLRTSRALAAYEPMREALEEVIATYVVRIGGKVDKRRAGALTKARAALALAEKG